MSELHYEAKRLEQKRLQLIAFYVPYKAGHYAVLSEAVKTALTTHTPKAVEAE